MLKRILLAALMLLAVPLSSTAQAPNNSLGALLSKTRQQLADAAPEQAYQSLRMHESTYAGQPEYDYWLGIAAFRSGALFEASVALQRAIQQQPSHAGARLELAGVYIQQNKPESARVELNRVKDMNPPARAQEAIAYYEAVLEKQQAAPVKQNRLVLLGIDIGYDTNYQNYPDSFDIFSNTIFEGFGLMESDETAYSSLRGTYWQRFAHGQDNFLEVSLNGQSRINFNSAAQSFNTHLVQGAVHYARRYTDKREFKVGLESGVVWLDNSVYRRHIGAVLHYQHPLTERTLGQLSGRIRPFTFQNELYNYHAYQLEGTLIHSINHDWRLRTQASVDYEEAANEPSRQGGSLQRQAFSLRVDRRLKNNHQLQGSLHYQRRSYLQSGFAIFNFGEAEKRREDIWTWRLEWINQPNRHWRFNSFVQYRDQRSTIDFFNLDQLLIQGGITYVF